MAPQLQENQSHKPALFKEPTKWLARQIKLKTGDLLKALGIQTVERINFAHFRGGDYAQVLDVGVADGSPDLYARFPSAALELFEPHPHYQEVIERSVIRNRKARLHKVALGDEAGSAQLHLKGRTGSSLVLDYGRGSVDVPVARLDALLSPDDIIRPCLLKIDTEGYEINVLRGALGLLDRIDCIVVEVHFDTPQQYKPQEIFDFLAGHGYELTHILDTYVGLGMFLSGDFVFERIDA